MKPITISRKSEQGAALVIGLILLLALTVLSVSGLGTATTEIRLADNNKQREYAYQAAESAIRATLQNGSLITLSGLEVENDTIRPTSSFDIEHNYTGSGLADAGVSVEVNTVYRGRGLPSSEACGNHDIETTTMVHMLIDSRAQGGRGARSGIRQGFCIPAPK